jgi:hypothetical protein
VVISDTEGANPVAFGGKTTKSYCPLISLPTRCIERETYVDGETWEERAWFEALPDEHFSREIPHTGFRFLVHCWPPVPLRTVSAEDSVPLMSIANSGSTPDRNCAREVKANSW